jgi:hypothetical protein
MPGIARQRCWHRAVVIIQECARLVVVRSPIRPFLAPFGVLNAQMFTFRAPTGRGVHCNPYDSWERCTALLTDCSCRTLCCVATPPWTQRGCNIHMLRNMYTAGGSRRACVYTSIRYLIENNCLITCFASTHDACLNPQWVDTVVSFGIR